MPLDEEGAKWSCEPCVRGHRSSKCQHFDRMMMKVPKAGRPLAKCPHPKGSCSCQKLYAFMVRIPKGSTCLCRPLYKVPMAMSETGQSPSTSAASPALPDPQSAAAAGAGASAMLPPTMPLPPPPPSAVPVASPSTKTTTSNKIQKPSKRENSARSLSELSAKDLSTHPAVVSLDQTSLMAPNPNLPSTTPSTSTFAPPLYPTAPMGAGDTVYPGTYYHPLYHAYSESLAAPLQKSHSEPAPKKGSSCCSANKPPSVGIAVGCSSSGSGVDGQQQTPIEPQKETSHHPAQDGHRHVANAHLPYPYPYPYHHPSHSTADWASPSDPLRHGLPHLNTAAAHPAASAPVSGYTSPNIKPQHGNVNYVSGNNQALSAYTQAFQMVSDQNHNCGCGDGCQCLGCASHPFNDTTRQHIQEMGYLMALREESPKENRNSPYAEQQQHQPHPKDSGYPQNLPFDNYHPPDIPAQSDTTDNNDFFEHTANLPGTSTDATLGSVPPTGTSGVGGGEEMLTMQPGAYLTVEYPVGFLDPCSNMSGTCQCGSNCTCVGCLTHNGHSGVPLEPSPPPEDADFAPIPPPDEG